eukprot:1344679-Amorphochlora_amoeboformis.AAC.1
MMFDISHIITTSPRSLEITGDPLEIAGVPTLVNNRYYRAFWSIYNSNANTTNPTSLEIHWRSLEIIGGPKFGR